MKSRPTDPPFWQDRPFWLALSLGPLCWLAMFLLGVPLRDGTPPWKSLLWAALLYPVLEEYVFRGGLQAELFKRTSFSHSKLGVSIANVMTSVLFAAMHLISQPPIWAALVFVPSLVFGWMRDRYSHIYASIALHIVYNAGFIWLYSA
ncbi:MAG: JDVT-CTERM system glutamic-type intramembrane protease [Granulosicoccus sp.]